MLLRYPLRPLPPTAPPPDLPPHERLTWELDEGCGSNRRFRRRMFQRIPSRFLMPIAERYAEIYGRSEPEANLFLLGLGGRFSHYRLSLAASDDELVAFADRRANECACLAVSATTIRQAYDATARLARFDGIAPPEPSEALSLEGAVARASDALWWRRALRRTVARQVESEAIRIGFVHRRAGIYASDETVARRRQQKARNRRTLHNLLAVNELGQQLTVEELAAKSTSNPRIRRCELMVRIAGFEAIARDLGHAAMFYTITCPSRMHARLARTGENNPRADGTPPRDAQAYLSRVWARARAKLHRDGLGIYGFRVAEPQHDGTPHWHLLLFCAGERVSRLSEVLRKYALQEDAEERGAADHRVRVVAIDHTRGTAAGYIAKYVAKNIDGFGLDEDLYGGNAKSAAERVDAWASAWGIRQFQQMGRTTHLHLAGVAASS